MRSYKWSFRRMKQPKEPRSRREIQAELDELKPEIYMAQRDVDDAQEELDRAEAVLDDLTEKKQELLEELEPLLRPWERPRPKRELKILQYLEGVVCKL